MCSQNCTPGTAVAIGWKAPRTSSGASGLGSHMSIWLCPPLAKTRITDFARPKPRPVVAEALPLRSAAIPRVTSPKPASVLRRSQARRVVRHLACRAKSTSCNIPGDSNRPSSENAKAAKQRSEIRLKTRPRQPCRIASDPWSVRFPESFADVPTNTCWSCRGLLLSFGNRYGAPGSAASAATRRTRKARGRSFVVGFDPEGEPRVRPCLARAWSRPPAAKRARAGASGIGAGTGDRSGQCRGAS